MKVQEAKEIVEKIKELKILLIKGQDFVNAATMRDMEKEYLNRRVEE